MRAVLVPLGLLAVAACGDDIKGNISVSAPEAWSTAIGELVALTPYRGLSMGSDGDYRIEIVDDAAIPAEGYKIDAPDVSGGASTLRVHAHDVLGAQYGATVALEDLGFHFRHPFDPFVPRTIEVAAVDSAVHQPAIRVRGLHLHTLHPIESYFALWEPSAGSTNDAHRIIDWIIKNKGNYVQWAGLDNIQRSADDHTAWKAFTKELIDYAHMRGVRVGLDIELFGKSNLQLAFDLHDTDNETLQASIAARLPLITDGLPFDVYDLSFGEFFNSEPQVFIDATNEVASQLRTFAPQAEMHALVHVGATQRVQYMGRDLLYYFLVQYCDPSIVPDIHSVMYFNLYDPTDGAYQHTDFSEHRQYLLDRICTGQKAAYHPETAYWVAFDDSLPMYLPVYVYSRWRDLDGLAKDGCGKPLDEHLIFSTGWEWGYWLHDVAALQSTYELPAAPVDSITQAFGTDLGATNAKTVEALMDEQKHALIDEALSGYLAGRDLAIDAGRMLDPPIISQPDRISYEQLAAAGADVDGFEANILTPLVNHATRTEELTKTLESNGLPDSRWGRELRDGFRIDVQRTWFMAHTYQAVVAHVRGDESAAQAAYKKAVDDMARGKSIIEERHRDLHDTHGRRLVDMTANHTFYQFGYLQKADTQCYWQRELVQVGAILGNTTEVPPGCLF